MNLVRENQIYIFPSLRGHIFLAMVVVMILTASTYNNNLIFILAFFMFSVFVVSMLQTHYQLKGVTLKYLSAEEGFAGDTVHLLFHLSQKRAQSRPALQLRSRARAFPSPEPTDVSLSPTSKVISVKVPIRVSRRGVWPVPSVVLETYYPLGLFRAWKVFRPQGEILVYPKPERRTPLVPEPQSAGDLELGLSRSPEGDFGELKTYQTGESYHQIAWKQYARSGDLYSKVYWGAEEKHYVIPWLKPSEDSLARMSGWIEQAQQEGASFEMQTQSERIDRGQGLEHARRCWRTLARVKV